VVTSGAVKGKLKKKRRRVRNDGAGHFDDGSKGGGTSVEGLVAVREHVVKEGEEEETNKQEHDDCKILKALFSGKGLSSVLSHDMVESTRDANVFAMKEEEAKKIAQVG